MAMAQPAQATPSFAARLLYRLLPLRRQVVLDNLQRVYGDVADEAEITRLAQAHYGHLGRLLWEFLWYPWLSRARKLAMVRVREPRRAAGRARAGQGRADPHRPLRQLRGRRPAPGWRAFPQAKGRFHFVRRPIRPDWLDKLVTRRFRKVGFGVLPKRGGLDAILDRLAAGDLVVFPFDQHAQRKDGVLVEFFGHPAGTFRSLAVIALEHRRAGGAGLELARARRQPRAALRGTACTQWSMPTPTKPSA